MQILRFGYYYKKNCHCKAKPTNVVVKTNFKNDGRKFIVVEWTVPQRGKLDKLTCVLKGVRITYSGSEYCDADGCTMLPSRSWKRDDHNDKNYQEIIVEEYWTHEIQVEMIYEGRLFGAEHPSEPSDKNELCHLCAPSNKPLIKCVGYNDRLLGIVWEKPTRPNGDILNYKLKIQQVGRIDKVQYFTFPVPSSDQKTEDGYDVHNQHVQLEPNKYNVSLSAENKDSTGQGEWSSSYILCVEKEMTLVTQDLKSLSLKLQSVVNSIEQTTKTPGKQGQIVKEKETKSSKEEDDDDDDIDL